MAGYIGSKSSVTLVDGITKNGGTLEGDLSFGDNDKAKFGAGDDLQIYHDGTHSYLDNNTGALFMRNNGSVVIEDLSGDNIIRGIDGGAVDLYHNGSAKLTTTSTGVDVTGKAVLTSGELTFSGSISDPNGAAYIWRPVDNTLAFGTANEERFRIDNSGTVRINDTGSQNTKLFVNYNTSTTNVGAAIISNPSSGASRALTVNIGSTGSLIAFDKSFAGVGSITTNGSSVAYNTTSDYRLKENVVDLTGASARVNQLNPSRFNFIADETNTLVDGFLAHEVATVVPEAITGTHDGMKDEEYEVTPAVLDDDGNVTTEAVMGTRSVPDYQGIDQSKLVPLLTAALQEALTEIASLKTRVEALEA